MEYGGRAIGVVLTGMLDDGTAGLKAIKDCGGLAVVQTPDDAQEPSMPLSALAYVKVDHVATLDEMPALLATLASAKSRRPDVGPNQALRDEHATIFGDANMKHLKAIGTPSAFTCPDCGGALFELNDQQPVRFVCHTGHAYSLRTLTAAREDTTDAALWTSLRALQEKEAIVRRLAEVQESRLPGAGELALREAEELAAASKVLRRFIEGTPIAVVP
jgi:two-component system, chemotaxis family, protein-glutamate methylesterase/glutaminase